MDGAILHPRRVLHRRDGLSDDHVGPDFLERLQGMCRFQLPKSGALFQFTFNTEYLLLSLILPFFSSPELCHTVNGREPMEFWRMAADLGVVLQQVSSVVLLWLTFVALQHFPTADVR